MSESTALHNQRSSPRQVVATVISQREAAPNYYRLTLQAPTVAHSAQAGQFVHVLAHKSTKGGEWSSTSGFDPLLRRAFSIMRVAGECIEILYRAGGKGTQLMSQWHTGDEVDLLGPLGQGFGALAPLNLLVGGGVGVPPMVMLAARGKREDKPCIALIGARSSNDVLGETDFSALETPFEVVTEDGSRGERGRVTLPLMRRLTACNPHDAKVFACGPLAMLRAVAKLCAHQGVACEVSLEEAMPCGVGVCNGCVVPVLTGSDDYGQYQRVCVEGPVLNASDVDWERI